MKEFLNKKTNFEEKKLHELRTNITQTDDIYWEAEQNREKIEYTEEQLFMLYEKEEEQKKIRHNEFADQKYFSPEYMERKFSDMEFRDFENM